MINAKITPSSAADLLQADLWLEVTGEPRPLLTCWENDGRLPANHLFEYAWSVGYRTPADERAARHLGWRPSHRPAQLAQLAQPALHVWLLFAADSGWRARVEAATVRHLAPLRTEIAWRQRLARDWNELAPVVGGVSTAAADVAGAPEIAQVAGRIASIRAASVPPSEDEASNWFVRSVFVGHRGRPYRGVEWVIGRDLVAEIGERVSGSLLVSFDQTAVAPNEDSGQAGVISRAVVHFADDVFAAPVDTTGDETLGAAKWDYLKFDMTPMPCPETQSHLHDTPDHPSTTELGLVGQKVDEPAFDT
jgi:hypothetical protein